MKFVGQNGVTYDTRKLERQIRAALRKVDPLKKVAERSPDDRYDRVIEPIAMDLAMKERTPTVSEVALAAYGAIVDHYRDIPAYNAESFRPIG